MPTDFAGVLPIAAYSAMLSARLVLPTDGRAADDHEVGRLQAGRERIEVREAGPDAADLAAVGVQVVEPVEGVVEKLLEGAEAGREPALRDGVQLRLGAIDRLLDLRRVLVADAGDSPGGGDQVPQDGLALDDAGVLRREDRRRRLLGERRQVAAAADRLEVAGPLERLGHGDDVDRLATLPEVEHRGVDRPVGLAVEVGRAEDVRNLDDGVAVDQEGAEDRLLGLEALGRKAVDGHVDSGCSCGITDIVTGGAARREWVVHESGHDIHEVARESPDPVDGMWTRLPGRPATVQSRRRMTPISFPWMRTSS